MCFFCAIGMHMRMHLELDDAIVAEIEVEHWPVGE